MQERYMSKGIKTLQEWMRSTATNKTDLAKMLDCTFSNLWNWLAGKTQPRLDAAAKIEVLTKGKVKCIYWTIPDEEMPSQKLKKQNKPKHHKPTSKNNPKNN